MIFGDGTGAVGLQQQLQVVHPALQFAALVGISDPHSVLHFFKNHAFIGNIVILVHGVPLSGKGLVGHNAVMAGIVDQSIARNAGGGLVSPAEAAVDNQQLSSALHGAFSLFHLHRHMAVDNMAMLAFQTELLQEPVTDRRILIIGIVGILRFRPGVLVRKKAVPPAATGLIWV